MPIYEFACVKCGILFSFFSKRVNTETIPACPKCGEPLVKQVSLFQARSGSPKDSDPWGMADDGCDDDTASAPDFDTGDERLAGAIQELGNKIDSIDYSDPQAAAKVMREFADKSGMKFNKGVTDALARMASGEDSTSVADALQEAIASGNPFASDDDSSSHDKALRTDFIKDPTLYDM